LGMHPQIEKFTRDFMAFRQNPADPIPFFQSIWIPVLGLPRHEVKALYSQIYEWAEENRVKWPKIFAMATFSKGFIAFHGEMYEEALRYFNEAEKLFEQENDEDGVAICQSSYGGTYRTLGNLDLALKYLTSAFHRLHQTHAYPIFENVSSYALSSLYLELKNYERAIPSFQQCVNISVGYGNKNFEMLSYGSLGEAFHGCHQEEQALRYFDQALALGELAGNNNFYSRVLSDVGTFYLDQKNYEQAIRFHEQALQLREDLHLVGGAITNLQQLSRIYSLQGNPEAAIGALRRAMKLAEEIQVKPKLFQLHRMLSEIYEQQGQTELSYRHFKLFHQLSEEVNREDGAEKLKRSEMIFEAEQTKKENAIIKAQKVQIEKANIALQKTIDELTISKINRRAKTITTIIAVILFILEDALQHFAVAPHTHDSFLIALAANLALAFSIKPIEQMVEQYLLQRFVKIRKEYRVNTG